MSEEKKEKKLEKRSTTLQFIEEKSYFIERDEKKNLFINGELIPIKTSTNDFNEEEKYIYNEAKLIEDKEPEEKKGYALVKVSLCYFFMDEEKFPDICEAIPLEIADAIILRLWSNEPIQTLYEYWGGRCQRIKAPFTKKYDTFPMSGSQFADTDFNLMIASLENDK
jgi:hypothetical protein